MSSPAHAGPEADAYLPDPGRASAQTVKPLVSYVFPVYNEEGNLELLLSRVQLAVQPLIDQYDFEFVFVDDGSRDGSVATLTRLASSDPRVVVVELSRNFGHQVAVTAGLDTATGDAIVIMDSDLQDPPEVSVELIRRWEAGADVVYAQRRSRRDSVFKRVTAAAYYRLLAGVASVDIPRNTGDFRLINRAVADQLSLYREHNRFIRGLVSHVGFRQEAVQFDRNARHAGSTGYPLRAMFRFAADGVLSFSVVPLQLISRLGVGVSALSFAALLYVLGVKVFSPETSVPGWAFLGAGIFFLGGLQLLMLGVLGAYIGRIYTEVQGRPLYGVRAVRRSSDRAGRAAQ
ncbi:MAG TPA: glycosyltransferase family 2 protein [Actinotalea sp.]|nr:glycosyltransferase family 2 protein [Actinotalea sp.]